jgi:hypothetical protein
MTITRLVPDDSTPEERAKILEELLKPVPPQPDAGSGSSVFSIKELDDCYRITGVQYGLGAYDFAKTTLPSKTPEQHAEHAKKAKPDEFVPASAPPVYAICKTLYNNRNGVQKELVKKARKTLEEIIGPEKPWINTLSRAKYNPAGKDKFLHNYKQKNEYPKDATLVGPGGLITKPETQAQEYAQALLDTTDTVEQINTVFKWITTKDSYAYRINNKLEMEEEWVVVLGVNIYGRFNLIAGNYFDFDRPAFGVRPAQKNST